MKRKIYEKIKGTGTLRDVPAFLSQSNRDNGQLLMCPYTNYIPLSYILLAEDMISRGNQYSYLKEVKIPKARQKFYETGIFDIAEKAFRDFYVNKSTPLSVNVLKRMMEYTNNYLFYDRALCVYKQRASVWSDTRREGLINEFGQNMAQFYQRSYNGFVSPYSLYRRDGIGDGYTPHILAVVRPEHYLKLKLKFLLTGKIDMSMVVIFIDSELDTTAFPVPAFKSLYKAMKPKILDTTAQIWRVPLSYIQENCFLPKFQLKEKNILKRKEEIDGLIQEFYDNERSSPTTIDNLAYNTAGSVGIIEQIRQSAPITNYATGNLTWSSTPFTISTGIAGMQALNEAFGMETLNSAISSALYINSERQGDTVTVTSPSMELEEYDEGAFDGPQTDGMDEDILHEEDWMEGVEMEENGESRERDMSNLGENIPF